MMPSTLQRTSTSGPSMPVSIARLTRLAPPRRPARRSGPPWGASLLRRAGAYNVGSASMNSNTDFLRMEYLRGNNVVAPILLAGIARDVDVRNPFVRATDATYEGYYSYPVSAFAPECGPVTLKVYSEKEPRVPTLKILDRKTVDRVWQDFEAWRNRSPQ